MHDKMWLSALTILCVGVCFAEVSINVQINVNEGGQPKSPPIAGGGGMGGILGGIMEGIMGGGGVGGPSGAGGSGGPPYGGSGAGGPPSGVGGSGGSPWGGSGSGGGPPPGVLDGFTSDGKPCPDPPVEQNFNLTQYLGRWYEVERMFNPFQSGGCVTADYSLRINGTVKVVNSNGIINDTQNTLEGTAILSNGTEGRLTVSFPMSGGKPYNAGGGANYNILKTDYDNYAIVYTCATFKIYEVEAKIEFGWILSRVPTLTADNINMLKTYMDSINIDSQKFNSTNQENCPRLPIKRTY